MVDFDISHDFSLQVEGTALSPLQQTLAKTFGKRYLDSAEVKGLLTNDGKKITARVRYCSTAHGIKVSDIQLAPAPGSHITNIDTLMRALRKTKGTYICGSADEVVRFTRQYNYGDVDYSIRTRTPAPEVPSTPKTNGLEEAVKKETGTRNEPKQGIEEFRIESTLTTEEMRKLVEGLDDEMPELIEPPKQPAKKGIEELRIQSTMTPEEIRAALADIDDSMPEQIRPTATQTQETQEPKRTQNPTKVPDTLEDIAGYSIVGERNESEFYARHDREISCRTISAMRDTIFSLKMSCKGNPLVAYTTADGEVTRADVFPPKGETITYVELSKQATLLKEQRPGMIRASRGPTEIVIHRRHLDEKYDIRGELSTTSSLKVRAPSEDEVGQVRKLITNLPINVRASDDTEANVTYQQPFGEKKDTGIFSTTDISSRIMFAPKPGASLYVVGLEEAVGQRTARTRNRSERLKEIEFMRKMPESTLAAVVFTTSSTQVKNWENLGSTEKDFFDRFYDQHRPQQEKNQ